MSLAPDLLSRRHAVRRFIKRHGTQKAAADALGVSQAALSRAIADDTTNRRLLPIEKSISDLESGQSDGGQGKPPDPDAPDPTEARTDDDDGLDRGDLIEIPTAPYGHAANFDFVIDNTDGERVRSFLHEATLRAMLGGMDVPRDSDGNVAIRLSFAVGDSMAPFIPDGHPFIYRVGGGFVDGARYALWLGSTQADVIKRVEVQGGGVVYLRSDNSNIRTKRLQSAEEPGVWLDEDGRSFELDIRGQVIWPLDTPAAVVGQITDRLTQLARAAVRA